MTDRAENQPGVSLVWQIVTVPAVSRLRLEPAYIPLVARSGVLLLCSLMAVLLGVGPSLAVLPAMLLLCVAALASLPLPSAVPAFIPPVAESFTAALVVGALGSNGVLFLLYLLIPVATGGFMAGPLTGLSCAVITSAVLVAASQTAASRDMPNLDATTAASWVIIFVAVGLLGAWMRRLRDETAPDSEPAYADAHRLLSELHVVARQLSLGLDPRTLASALADDIRAIVPHGDTVVLARSPGGRFVALIGKEPEAAAEQAVHDAWVSASPIRRRHGDACVAAVPVLMGDRVVALVVITTDEPVDPPALDRCQAVVSQSGPRLASAMLFDDVRRLATVDERMRLAREIHDGIAQDLASVGYALDDIRRDSDAATAGQVIKVREQMQAMVADLRLSIFDLRTGVDDSIPLGTAVSEYAQRVGGQSGLVVHYSIDESPRRLPHAVEVELLRIVQEAITNVRKHARAKNLWLTVTVEPPNAHVTVVDDGRGLRPGRADSFGITGMRERAERIGATLTVGPAPQGGGTMVELALGSPTPHEALPSPRPVVTREALTDPRGLTLPATTTAAPVTSRADQEVT